MTAGLRYFSHLRTKKQKHVKVPGFCCPAPGGRWNLILLPGSAQPRYVV